jgi:FixJ family two-component response regulator
VAIVYTSGKPADDPDVRALPRDGRVTFLEKPVDADTLAQAVERLLEQRASATADAPGGTHQPASQAASDGCPHAYGTSRTRRPA